ncbi:hypothetical protein VCHC40A1_3220, partial [Vibrio cholerae HC-40A1]
MAFPVPLSRGGF